MGSMNLTTFPRVASWGRENEPKCITIIMQPTDGAIAMIGSYAAAIRWLAAQPDARPHIEQASRTWHTPEYKVWQDIHEARNAMVGHVDA